MIILRDNYFIRVHPLE